MTKTKLLLPNQVEKSELFLVTDEKMKEIWREQERRAKEREKQAKE